MLLLSTLLFKYRIQKLNCKDWKLLFYKKVVNISYRGNNIIFDIIIRTWGSTNCRVLIYSISICILKLGDLIKRDSEI